MTFEFIRPKEGEIVMSLLPNVIIAKDNDKLGLVVSLFCFHFYFEWEYSKDAIKLIFEVIVLTIACLMILYWSSL